MSRRRRSLPIAAWVAVGATGTVVLVAGMAALVLAPDGLADDEVLALGLALTVGLAFAVVAVVWSRRVTVGLHALHEDAVRRLRDPSLRVGPTSPDLVPPTAELGELSRVLDALHLRARVADEVAEQARRTAEHAGAGVFELLSGLVAAEEATRGQLSAELHDTVAQSLAAARALLSDSDLGVPEADRVARVRELVEDAEEQVRAVMARTRPAELRDGDLASAVGALRREFALRYLVTVRLSWPEEPYPLPLVSAVTVYRFFQEALLNVVKHADVDEADASLRVEGNQLVAEVRDAGPGFEPAEVRSERGRHVGLGLLRERARLAGGSLAVDSAPGAGTTLTLRLPLSPRTVALDGGVPAARVGGQDALAIGVAEPRLASSGRAGTGAR